MQPNSGPGLNLDGTPVRAMANRLIEEARQNAPGERRVEQRKPFFRPASIIVAAKGKSFDTNAAFVTNLSAQGIGLLHRIPLHPGVQVTVTVRGTSGALCMQSHIQWCKSCGDGWYVSGGQLLDRP